RLLEIGRSSEVLGLLGILSVEDNHDLALVTVGGVVDSWIDKARRPLHFDMPIEDRTPLAIVPHLMTDDHHSLGILLLLPVTLRRRRSSLVATFILAPETGALKACESCTGGVRCHRSCNDRTTRISCPSPPFFLPHSSSSSRIEHGVDVRHHVRHQVLTDLSTRIR